MSRNGIDRARRGGIAAEPVSGVFDYFFFIRLLLSFSCTFRPEFFLGGSACEQPLSRCALSSRRKKKEKADRRNNKKKAARDRKIFETILGFGRRTVIDSNVSSFLFKLERKKR